MLNNNQLLETTRLEPEDSPERRKQFIIPATFVGIGGYGKLVLPRLDALLYQYFGHRPQPISMVTFDFDDANGQVNANSKEFSTQPYLIALPKKPLKDVAIKLRRKDREKKLPWISSFEKYVNFDHVKYADAPGLNLFMQTANLAWRLVWESHVLPGLKSSLQNLHPAPQLLNRLEKEGYSISNRSMVFVIGGGASTTGPSGLPPMLAELKRLKPADSNLFPIIFTPHSYRDKTDEHKARGRAIFRSTMDRLLNIFNDLHFDQPYGVNGYRIKLQDQLFDHIFFIDGSLSGGRGQLQTDQMGDIVAKFLFKLITSPVGEHFLGTIGNLNSGLREEAA